MNMKVLLTLFTTLLFTLTAQSANASMKNAKVALISGSWKVLHDKDIMTDKTTCTGIYKDNYGVQLSDDILFIKVPGGIQSVTLRFGDEPAEPLRLPTKMEKEIGVIMIEGHEFKKLKSVSKLRYQSATLVKGVESGELDLTGFAEALKSIENKCPLDASSSVTPSKENKAGVGSLCNSTLVNRMQEAGVKQSEIEAICL